MLQFLYFNLYNFVTVHTTYTDSFKPVQYIKKPLFEQPMLTRLTANMSFKTMALLIHSPSPSLEKLSFLLK